MTTTCANIQAVIQAALTAHSWFATAGITVLLESQPATPDAFETAMQSPGACIIIGLPSITRNSGEISVTLHVPVEIYEDVAVNRASGGTSKRYEDIAENVWAACEGYTNGTYPQFTPLLPQNINFDMVDLGLMSAMVDIQTTSGILVTTYT